MTTFVSKYAKERGLKMVDGKQRMAVTVLPGDIKKAKVKDSTCCAFAEAAKRQGAKSAVFFRSTAWIELGDKMVKYALPSSVQKEIVSFDRAKVMAPGNYQLSPPSKARTIPSLRAASQANTKPHNLKKRGSSGIKRGVVHQTQLIRTTLDPRRG